MSHSAKVPRCQIEKWTTEDVHRWLTTVVKVSQACADKFVEEDVSGEYLIPFEKKDVLDLGIKHGPAVKITHHLKRLNEGSQPAPQFPAYVENWTTEQVHQWLRQHVNVYDNYAERLKEEDVSGSCLVCFEKQDLLDLKVKSGPAVKILHELLQLKDKPEPELQPILPPKEDQKDTPEPTQPELSLVREATSRQPEPCDQFTSEAKEMNRNSGDKADVCLGKVREHKTRQKRDEAEQPLGTRMNKNALAKPQPQTPSSSIKILNILDDLPKDELRNFQFHLLEFKKPRIPRGKLEDKGPRDTAKLLTAHYGNEKALHVTRDVLLKINQRELARRLENEPGLLNSQPRSEGVLKREGNQGDKLKYLLTCGGNSLDNYDTFVVILNKSKPEQVEYLQFLSKLKLFSVLDFDPNSATPGGVCHSYRETRVANLHSPTQYQGQPDAVIKNLNLSKQTSWVFCNGRHDLDDESHKELDYKTWLRKTCRDVEHLVSFICSADILLHSRGLVIFLLLSPVSTDKDPVFDIYKCFLKHAPEESIISICESQRTYVKWRELIQEKCDSDIDQLSIYELNLSEINGKVLELGPFTQSSGRLLPCADGSAVVLKQRDEDLMTALDILCLNQCENIYDENGANFHKHRIEVEEKFYRGGKVEWWNFYFSDKDKEKPFIKRDKYENVKNLIRGQVRDQKNACAVFNLFHHPGCGGTTLAMHVMWDLRKELRCAVLKDNKDKTLTKTEVAHQVLKLMKLESEKPSPVLLLVDDTKETENHYELVNCIRRAREDFPNTNVDDAQNSKVIIFNCVRSQSPRDQYRKHNPMLSQFIVASLTQEEQREFENKLKELKETHETPENFYSFMIMKSNFDKKYVDKLARNTLENFDFSRKEARLFAFLALLNKFVADSEMSLSLCEDFLGLKMTYWKHWQADSVLDRMKPYSNFLIIDRVEEWGGYKGVRTLHHSLAEACLEELEKRCLLKVSDIAMEILHCDLFFSVGVVKHRFELAIQQMLIERQRRKDGNDRELFSSFIDRVHSQQGRQTVQKIFEKASSRFDTSASIPQALARYLYINERDFPEALEWAEKAKEKKENPYTFDTIGQIHKSNLKTNIQREKQETSQNPEDLHTDIKIAENAIRAFKGAQELANAQDEVEEEADDDDNSEDYPRKSYSVNGYVGLLDIAFLVFEILARLPFFEERDPMKKKYLQSFLEKAIPISSVYKEDNEINHRYEEIIRENEHFLLHLKTEVKETFELLKCYFTYIKANYSEFDSKNRSTVSSHFTKYVELFFPAPEERKKALQDNPNLKVKIIMEEKKLFLEEKNADTFAGILQHLDKPEEMEHITECYAFLQQQSFNKSQNTKTAVNFILSNILLYLLKPKFKYVKGSTCLSNLLLKLLQDVGLNYRFPDPYYLAVLLFWPSPTEQNPEIGAYVTAIRNSSRKQLTLLARRRSTVAHLYLGKGDGLKRLVSKPQLDDNFKKMRRDTLAQLWRNGDIFKEPTLIDRLHRVSGTVEHAEVYATYGKLKIPVRPALIASIRSGSSNEKVSFYVGFAINGPLAYDIQYEN